MRKPRGCSPSGVSWCSDEPPTRLGPWASPPAPPGGLVGAVKHWRPLHLAALRRVDWSDLAERAVLTGILAIAALISYTHLRAVWQHAGAPWADLGPLLVDGLFASAWLRMRRRRREGTAVGPLAWLALYLALVATLAGNVAAAHIAGHREPLDYVVAAWPAVVLALSWELVTGHARSVPARARPDQPSLLDRARELIAKAGKPLGRPTLARELDINPNGKEARELMAQLNGSGAS